MENLNKDMLIKLGLELKLPDLLKFCSSEKRINEKVCNNKDFWLNKLLLDFPDYKILKLDKSLREIYRLLYELTVLKTKLDIYAYTIYELYELKSLKLYSFKEKVKIIPKEIGILQNLESLWIQSKILEIPKEIGKLEKLEWLTLYANSLTIPEEIGNLPNLKRLELDPNMKDKIPRRILENKQIFVDIY